MPQYLQLSSTALPRGFTITTGGTITFQPFLTEGVTYRLVPISVELKGIAVGTYQDVLRVTNTVEGAVTSVPVTLTVNPAPQISSLSVTAVQAGAPGFTLLVNGSNFSGICAVRWNGTSLTTTYVSASQLKAQIPASLIAAQGSAAITVGTPDGAASNSISLGIESFTMSSLSPANALAGDAGFTLTITGSGFVPGMTVKFGSTVLQASSVTSTQIAAAVPAKQIATDGAIPVSVSSPGGTGSNPLSFNVAPIFRIDTLSPTTVMVGGPSFTLEISGAGFVSGSTVKVGTVEYPPDSLAAGKIVVTIPASLVARAGSLPVSVLRPGLPAASGPALTVSAVPLITLLNPASVVAKSASFTLSVAGVGFVPGSTVRWNAQALPSTQVSSTQLTATVPAGLIDSLGTALIDVSAGGAFSNAVMIRITPPGPPTLTSINPATVPVGTPVSITLSGAGFTPGCAVVITPPSGATVRVVTDSCTFAQVVVRLPGSVLRLENRELCRGRKPVTRHLPHL